MSFFSNLLGWKTNLAPSVLGFISIKKLGECCLEEGVSIPAIDIITILRIVWSRRFEGPFGDILTNCLNAKHASDVRVILIPSGSTTEKIIGPIYKKAFENMMHSEVQIQDERLEKGYPNLGYDLPQFQLQKLMEFSYSDNHSPALPHHQNLSQPIGIIQDTPPLDVMEAFWASATKDYGAYRCYNSNLKNPGPYEFYRLNMYCKITGDSKKAYFSVIFRLLSDPCVEEICMNKEPGKSSSSIGIGISFSIGTPFREFVETLPYFSTDEEDEMMVVKESLKFTEGSASVAQCYNYLWDTTNYTPPAYEKIYWVTDRKREVANFVRWGPNKVYIAFDKTTNEKDRVFYPNPFWNDETKVKRIILRHLIIGRKSPDGIKLDYGWTPLSKGENSPRLVFHPAYLEKWLEDHPDFEYEASVVMKNIDIQSFDSISGYVSDQISTEEEYFANLCRYGYMDGSITYLYD